MGVESRKGARFTLNLAQRVLNRPTVLEYHLRADSEVRTVAAIRQHGALAVATCPLLPAGHTFGEAWSVLNFVHNAFVTFVEMGRRLWGSYLSALAARVIEN